MFEQLHPLKFNSRLHQKNHPFVVRNFELPNPHFDLRKFQQTPGTDSRYPKVQIWKDFLHKQGVEGLGSVPGACWNFLRFEVPNVFLEELTSGKMTRERWMDRRICRGYKVLRGIWKKRSWLQLLRWAMVKSRYIGDGHPTFNRESL